MGTHLVSINTVSSMKKKNISLLNKFISVIESILNRYNDTTLLLLILLLIVMVYALIVVYIFFIESEKSIDISIGQCLYSYIIGIK